MLSTADRDARVQRLRGAAHRKHEEATARANRAIIALRARGATINFNTVAAEGHISKDFLYTHLDLRQTIMAERRTHHTVLSPVSDRTSPASAAVKLDIAVKALAQLRAENTQLRGENARLLGELMAARRAARPASQRLEDIDS